METKLANLFDGSKLAFHRKNKGFKNQAELGIKAFGYDEKDRNAAQQLISKFERNLQEPTMLQAARLANVLGVHIRELYKPDFFEADNILPAEIPEYHSRPIPVVSWVQAGDFAEAIENWPVGVSGEGEPVFARKKVGPHAFGLRVKGDSMQPRYMEGDVIIVDPELDCESNCPCVAKLNDEVTFKLYYQNDKEIRLKALNDKYPDIVIDKNSRVDFKIIGKVVDMVPKL